MKIARILCSAMMFVFMALPDAAGEGHGTRAEAVEMTRRVASAFEAEGREAVFAAIGNPDDARFHDRDLYPFVYDLQGVNVAHGARPALVGKDLSGIRDQNGKYLIREMLEVISSPAGAGWVDYKWPHPQTDAIEDKSSYVVRMGDYLLGVGVYDE